MSTVPELVMVIINAYLDTLLVGFSNYVYDELLKQAADHLLVKLQATNRGSELQTVAMLVRRWPRMQG